MFSYHLSCFNSWLGVKLFQGYEYLPLSDVDDVACRWTWWGCSRLVKFILSWEQSFLFWFTYHLHRLVMQGRTWYIQMTRVIFSSYVSQGYVFVVLFLPSSRGVVDTWSWLDCLCFVLLAILWNEVLPSTYKRVRCNTREHTIPSYMRFMVMIAWNV